MHFAIKGVRPFLSEKYDITAHPRYKYLSDADKKNEFDIERFLNRRPAVVKENEQFDLYNVDVPDEEKKDRLKFRRILFMQFFTEAVNVLKTLVIALGAGLAVWGVVNLLEGYGNDNPGAKSQGIKQFMAN